MTFAPRRLAITVRALAAPVMLAVAFPAFATPGAYLSWQNKAPQNAAPAVTSGGETYPVPPSPYGQVGDPFVHALNWPTKGGKPASQPQTLANIEIPPPPAADMPSGPVSLSTPVPMPQPAPVRVPDRAVAPQPKPAPQAMAPIANPAPATSKTAATKPAAKQPVQKQAAAKPVAPQVAFEPAQPAPVPQQATNTDGYQVPTTSKYAGRIAAARRSQAADQAPPPQQAAAAPTKSAGHTATAPAPAEPLAAQETDHVFIPGEHYTNAEDGPRLYSLHRAYGLTPDPITVDRNATGAILDTADLNADEGPKGSDKDAKDGEFTDTSSDKSSDSKAQP